MKKKYDIKNTDIETLKEVVSSDDIGTCSG